MIEIIKHIHNLEIRNHSNWIICIWA